MSFTRRLAALGAPVLLAAALTGCGAGSPPTDASADDYCGAQLGLLEYIFENSSTGEQPPAGEVYDELQTSIEEQEETGTPEDMPDDARSAWEEQIESSQDVDEDEFTEVYESGDPDALDEELGGDEEGADALNDYNQETCASQLQELTGGATP